jgi:hypothetical protein
MNWERWVDRRLKELGKSAAGLGHVVGRNTTDRQTGSMIARGERKIAIAEVPEIAKYLEVSQAELLAKLGCDLAYQPAVTIDEAAAASAAIMRFYERIGKNPNPDQIAGLMGIVLRRWARAKDHETGETLDDIASVVFEVHQALA